jgi:hypothetical protein
MALAAKTLVHHAHPATTGADVTASVMSGVLLWHGRPKAALALRVMLPMAGSPAVRTLADFDALASTAPGRYVLAHMPPPVRSRGGPATP